MGSKKLLVADDSLTIQKVIRLALANEGYEIQAISDGNDAVQHISLFQPDLVLIDVSLPGKTAFEVKRAVNQESDLANTRFVLMSSAFERVDEAQASEVVFHGRLTKPFDPGHLREVLQQVFAQHPTGPRAAGAQILPPRPGQAKPASVTSDPLSSLLSPALDSPLDSPLDAPEDELPISSNQPTPPPIPGIIGGNPAFGNSPFAGIPGLTPPPVPQMPAATEPPPAAASIPPFSAPPTNSSPPDLPLSIPPLPADANAGEDRDADIRELTETTIRMSGLNDFEWSVQEPSLKPPRSMTDTSELSNSALRFYKDPMPVQETSHTSPITPLSPLSQDPTESFGIEKRLPHPASSIDPPAYNLDLQPMPTATPQPPVEKTNTSIRVPVQVQAQPQIQPQAPAPAPDPQLIEKLVARQVEEVLTKSIQKLLPEIAERLIKEQIRQMLSEQP